MRTNSKMEDQPSVKYNSRPVPPGGQQQPAERQRGNIFHSLFQALFRVNAVERHARRLCALPLRRDIDVNIPITEGSLAQSTGTEIIENRMHRRRRSMTIEHPAALSVSIPTFWHINYANMRPPSCTRARSSASLFYLSSLFPPEFPGMQS